MSGVKRGNEALLGLNRDGQRRRLAGLLGAEVTRDTLHRYDQTPDGFDDTGAAGDERIAAAAKNMGHNNVGSDAVVPPTQIGSENYHG
jgi:hypothetical protein